MPTLLEPPMTSLASALRPKRPATPAEAETIRLVQELAVEWDDGRLPLAQVRTLSNGPKRWLTTRFTPPDHEAYPALMRMLDELIATADTDEGELIKTQHGYFSRKDLVDAEVRVVREDGNVVMMLPVRHPWLRKPDDEKGIDGQRAPAAYRAADERRPIYGHFGQKPPAERKERETPWWEMTDDDG